MANAMFYGHMRWSVGYHSHQNTTVIPSNIYHFLQVHYNRTIVSLLYTPIWFLLSTQLFMDVIDNMRLEIAALIYPANIYNSLSLLKRRSELCQTTSDVHNHRERASLLFLFFSIMLSYQIRWQKLIRKPITYIKAKGIRCNANSNYAFGCHGILWILILLLGCYYYKHRLTISYLQKAIKLLMAYLLIVVALVFTNRLIMGISCATMLYVLFYSARNKLTHLWKRLVLKYFHFFLFLTAVATGSSYIHHQAITAKFWIHTI